MLTIHIREFDALVISSVKLGGKDALFEGNFNYLWILHRESVKLQKHKLILLSNITYLSFTDI